MRRLTIFSLLLILFLAMALTRLPFPKTETEIIAANLPDSNRIYKGSEELLKLRSKAVNAKSFASQNLFDTSVCFLIDMSLPANHRRFFIYDFTKNKIHSSGLVTHGNCNQLWLEGRKYGNEIGCGCTSLGKYKIGKSYHGKFGLAFKLHGLDPTNDNAFKRYVVLHAHSCVPNTEVPEEICQSSGCPTISPEFLEKLSAIIKNKKQPVLLWIYE